MPQNEFINKLNEDIALSMPPHVNPPAYPDTNDGPVYHVPVDPVPAYPGPQVSTKPAAQNVPTDPGFKAAIFGQDSVSVTCKNCFNLISTSVDSSISQSGLVWAIVCCCFGSWIASCLVNCLPGFRKYTHSCPRCNAIVGEVEPKHSGCHMVIIGVAVLLVLALIGFFIIVRFAM